MQFIDLKSQQARIREDIEARISKVLDHGQYILGPEIKEMEEMLASYVGVKHCVGASSGTDTLLIALLALGIGPGDEVITVPYTWISTAEMIALVGAKPVFVDIEEDKFCLDPKKIESIGVIGTGMQARLQVSHLSGVTDCKNIKVWGIPAKGGGSRAFCDKMNSWAIKEGQPGLGYIFFKDGKGSGPIAKNIGEEKTSQILSLIHI